MTLDLKQHHVDPRCREWVWEYILKHCSNNSLIRALVSTYPIPHDSPRLKRMLLLKSLSFDLDEDRLSERTLETISLLLEIYRSEGLSLHFHGLAGCKAMFTIPDLLLAVKAECSVQYLRKETDDWPKFNASLEKLWGIDEHGAQDAEVDKDRFLELKHQLWAVQKRPHLRHDLLKKYDREFVKLIMKGFLSDAWQIMGSVFLEQMAEKNENSPRGLQHIRSPVVKKMQRVDDIAPQLERPTHLPEKLYCTPAERPADGSYIKVLGKRSSEIIDKRLHVDGSAEMDEAAGSGRGIVDSGKYQEKPHALSTVEEIQLQSRRIIPANVLEKPDSKSRVAAGLINELKIRTSVHQSAEMQSRKLVNDQFSGQRFFPTEHEDATGVQSQEEKASTSPSPWAESHGPYDAITIRRKKQKLSPGNVDAEYVDRVNLGNSDTLGTPEIQRALSALQQGQANLIAAVKDPLPEAIKIADEVAKSNRYTGKVSDLSGEPKHDNEHVRRQDFVSGQCNKELIVLASSSLRPREQVYLQKQRGSIMERNRTAQTMEWETSDDMAVSSDEDSLSESRKIHLPRIHKRQGVTRLPSHNVPRRRKFRRWTKEEEDVLRKEVERYGKGHWKQILQRQSEVFENRTEVDLKDKWRNIERREGILFQD